MSNTPYEQQPFEAIQINESRNIQSSPLDFKRVFYRAIKYWYVLVFALLVSLLIAFAVNRYTTQIFRILQFVINIINNIIKLHSGIGSFAQRWIEAMNRSNIMIIHTFTKCGTRYYTVIVHSCGLLLLIRG